MSKGLLAITPRSTLATEIRTERLILRSWRAEDRTPFARLNADAQVMEYMPRKLSMKESDAFVDRIEEHFRQHGFALYAAELRSRGAFIGFIGLHIQPFRPNSLPVSRLGGDWQPHIGDKGSPPKGHRQLFAMGSNS